MRAKRTIRIVLLSLAVVAIGIQLVPFGRQHTNPPVVKEPNWDTPRTKELATRACLDCHSNQTRWPWYSSIAPVSWKIQKHVDEGRQKLNLSLMDRPQEEASEAAEVVSEGEMPPRDYVLAHPEARLTASERADLMRGLAATFGTESGTAEPGNAAHNENGEGDDD